jgi:hypothetical protein
MLASGVDNAIIGALSNVISTGSPDMESAQELRQALAAMSIDARRIVLVHDDASDCWLLVDSHTGFAGLNTESGHTLAAFFEGGQEPPALARWLLDEVRRCGQVGTPAAA